MLLLAAYIISAGFTDVLSLPVIGKKIQLPELIFIPLFISWIYFFRKDIFTQLKPDSLQWSIVVFLLVMTLSAANGNQLKGYFEVIGLVYLILVMIIFITSLTIIPNPSKWITKSFAICGLIAATLGILGWLLFQFGTNNTLVKFEPHYPYLGQIARATGLTTTPNMLFNLVGVCFLIYLSSFLSLSKKRPEHYLVLIILSMALLLTFSKTLLLLLISILGLWYQHSSKSNGRKITLVGFSLAMFIICMIGTHFVFIKPPREKNANMYEGYFEKEPLASIGAYEIYPSNYAVLKKTSIIAGTENILGVGPGGYNDFLQKLKSAGRYPEHYENFDPHSLYTGTFGELGIFGLLALLWMTYEVARRLIRVQKTNTFLAKGLMACFIFFALEGLVLDILNFRHLWILLGMLAFISAYPRFVFDSTIPLSPDNRRTPG